MFNQSDLSAAIKEAELTRSPVQLVGGPIVVTDTIDIGKINGLKMTGASSMMGRAKPSATVEMIWNGPPDKPMFRSMGSGLNIGGFHIHLASPVNGVFQFVDQPKFADGKAVIEDISVTCADHARGYDFVIAGETKFDGHCDQIAIIRPRLQFARSILSTRNDQSMGHVIDSPHTLLCECGLDLQYGGIVYVSGIWTTIKDRCLVKLGDQGRNNCLVVVNMLKIDSQTSEIPGEFALVSGGSAGTLVKFNDGLVPSKVAKRWSFSQLIKDAGQGVSIQQGLHGLRMEVI